MGRVFEDGFEHYFQQNAEKSHHYYAAAAGQGHQLAIRRMIAANEKGELGIDANEREAERWSQALPDLPQR
jgi:TPR repeat protein